MLDDLSFVDMDDSESVMISVSEMGKAKLFQFKEIKQDLKDSAKSFSTPQSKQKFKFNLKNEFQTHELNPFSEETVIDIQFLLNS